MANRILLKRSNVPGKKPAPNDLLEGEIAINTHDLVLYTKDSSGNISPISTSSSSKSEDNNIILQDEIDKKFYELVLRGKSLFLKPSKIKRNDYIKLKDELDNKEYILVLRGKRLIIKDI